MEARMLIVTLRLSVPLHMTSHVIDLFESYRGPVSVRAGCRSIQLYNHFSTPRDFILIEEWSSPQALHNHIRSDDFRKVLALMDLAAQAPDLRFHRVSSAKGFDLVRELRQEGVDAESGRV
jgi:quinol monooxygenase YgiN